MAIYIPAGSTFLCPLQVLLEPQTHTPNVLPDPPAQASKATSTVFSRDPVPPGPVCPIFSCAWTSNRPVVSSSTFVDPMASITLRKKNRRPPRGLEGSLRPLPPAVIGPAGFLPPGASTSVIPPGLSLPLAGFSFPPPEKVRSPWRGFSSRIARLQGSVLGAPLLCDVGVPFSFRAVRPVRVEFRGLGPEAPPGPPSSASKGCERVYAGAPSVPRSPPPPAPFFWGSVEAS